MTVVLKLHHDVLMAIQFHHEGINLHIMIFSICGLSLDVRVLWKYRIPQAIASRCFDEV